MKWLQASLCFLAFSFTVYSQASSVLAQSYPTQRTWQISQKFKPPVDNQPNPPTIGAATRTSSCIKDKRVITPLLPTNQLGLTFNQHPTFYWSVPPTPVKTAEFTILAPGDEQIIYKTTLTLPDQPGITSFTLPTNAPALQINTTYRWYLTLICDAEESSNNPYVEGFVKRTQPDLTLSNSLAKSDLHQIPTIYAEAGIWHEALTSLVQLRCTQPNDLTVKRNWRKFLDSVELINIASEPLIDACTTKN
ncbi:DUF928 domain-containing protein [Anabaena cylindrica FACHB-243]|uniref:DUF928 domain-containing protein n=1 Tax=Anabaena cylindrica (strain ATCC 27899 / PCC 7122) TaxID=272123 RepID=K9ZGZ0_ANACC|nr:MULTISPECIES: DUF928 domain-containing protein [Anabaena]AFZ58024.1 protein of unknown function DUF928 [Anabaena cylindrica PCC 7122]MBD2419201.1 DUF928 domain-containing protein [Anabaena cylindrica FACHB-243]MBY5285250.1 DUF928 domain-containing protein [Anabaena sp. CCAP 1446/1C]MBY5311521.1 DUF928 domain-containing protein [Anabaena sp. CCAP 1446/1C]MCM2409673.1 DUF928 domain-containing protein [Anabaena sp. CCAP 1446/1C]